MPQAVYASAAANWITGVASESPVIPGKPTLEANPVCAVQEPDLHGSRVAVSAVQQNRRRERVIVIDAEDPGLLVLVAQRRSQRTIEIRNAVRQLAIERLEVGDAVLRTEEMIDLE